MQKEFQIYFFECLRFLGVAGIFYSFLNGYLNEVSAEVDVVVKLKPQSYSSVQALVRAGKPWSCGMFQVGRERWVALRKLPYVSNSGKFPSKFSEKKKKKTPKSLNFQ